MLELMHAMQRHGNYKRSWDIELETDPEEGKERTKASTGEAAQESTARVRELPALVSPELSGLTSSKFK